ncbi:MAG: type VI secretion system accessory protein TagJ [Desulfuromonadaceae bacterium]
MNPTELIKAGKLTEARAHLIGEVKASPGNSESRMLLVKVLVFLGEWDKVLVHLDILKVNESGTTPEIAFVRTLVEAEKKRLEVLQNKTVPDFMTDPPAILGEFLSAREKLFQGNAAEFSKLLSEMEDSQVTLSGTVNGVPFEGISDLDATLFPFLEAFIHDRYIWIPFTAIREFSAQPPLSLLDLVWTRARIVTWDGLTTDCILPVLYPGSGLHQDDTIRLGRVTDWVDLAGGYSRGVGQHILNFGDEEKGLLEIHELTIDASKQERSE